MSAKKVVDTKVFEDENQDSGFLSGTISEKLESEELDNSAPVEVDLSEQLDRITLVEKESLPPPLTPESKVTPPGSHDAPFLHILFQQDDDGDTQLHIAAVRGCEKSVATLIKLCSDKRLLNIPNDYGHTALHLAVMTGNAVVTKMLVIAGASLGARDLTGSTAVHVAAAGNHVACLQALLEPVSENPNKRITSILDQKNYNGQTCIHVAALSGHIETLHTLVHYGANINAREGLAGRTALHLAAVRGDLVLLKYLVKRCGGLQPGTRDFAGRTARRLARPPAAALLADLPRDDDDSDDDDDESYESDTESLFERIRDSMSAINVA